MIRALVSRAGNAVIEEIGEDLKSMQAIVGGYVEHVTLRGRFAGLHLWVNEQGRLDGLPLYSTPFYPEVLAGDFFITRLDDEGDTAGLKDEDVALLREVVS